MDKELITKLTEAINSSLNKKGSYPVFGDKSYKRVKIDKNNFHSITDSSSDKKVAFIDGGNTEIIGAANLSLQFVRVYYTIYKKIKELVLRRKSSTF